MLTVGNGWEVIGEDQLDELAKQQEQDDSESRQVDPRLQNYNNYMIKSNK